VEVYTKTEGRLPKSTNKFCSYLYKIALTTISIFDKLFAILGYSSIAFLIGGEKYEKENS